VNYVSAVITQAGCFVTAADRDVHALAADHRFDANGDHLLEYLSSVPIDRPDRDGAEMTAFHRGVWQFCTPRGGR
jgi:hypothetical protein